VLERAYDYERSFTRGDLSPQVDVMDISNILGSSDFRHGKKSPPSSKPSTPNGEYGFEVSSQKSEARSCTS
jgi:hypothetical protein